jgi:hypothetical protein
MYHMPQPNDVSIEKREFDRLIHSRGDHLHRRDRRRCPGTCRHPDGSVSHSHPAAPGSSVWLTVPGRWLILINKGHYGDVDLAGVKFWVAGDLGDTWRDGTTEWAIVTFQPGTTEAQKAGVTTALSHIFPVKWKSFKVAEDAEIEWMATEDRAEAKLAGGTKAHTILRKWQGMDGKTGILENIAYFGAPRNNGFKMMPNEVETWKVGDEAFEFKGTTGFMITVDMKSSDLTM